MLLAAEHIELLEMVGDGLSVQGQPAGVLQVRPEDAKERHVLSGHRFRGTGAEAGEDEIGRLNAIGLGEDPADLPAQQFGAAIVPDARRRGRVDDVEIVRVGVPDGLGAGVDDLLDAMGGGGLHDVPRAPDVDVEAQRWIAADHREVHDGVHTARGFVDLFVGGDIDGRDRNAVGMGLDVGEQEVVVVFQPRDKERADVSGSTQKQDVLLHVRLSSTFRSRILIAFSRRIARFSAVVRSAWSIRARWDGAK